MNRSRIIFLLGFIVTLTCIFAVVFFTARAEHTDPNAYPLDPPILHVYRKEFPRQLIEHSVHEHTLTVPIVLYHHIRPLSSAPDQLGRDLSVSPESFEEQLSGLQKNGHETITLDDLSLALDGKLRLPKKPIILTFDDGYDDNYTYAYPLLKRYGMRGTIFAIAEDVGKKGYISWDKLIEMEESSVLSIQSHTLTHFDLTSLSPARMRKEIVQSKKIFEERLNKKITFFCYPYGTYSEEILSLVRQAGYVGALTTRFGLRHSKNDIYEISRVRLTNADTGERLEKKLRLFDKAHCITQPSEGCSFVGSVRRATARGLRNFPVRKISDPTRNTRRRDSSFKLQQ